MYCRHRHMEVLSQLTQILGVYRGILKESEVGATCTSLEDSCVWVSCLRAWLLCGGFFASLIVRRVLDRDLRSLNLLILYVSGLFLRWSWILSFLHQSRLSILFDLLCRGSFIRCDVQLCLRNNICIFRYCLWAKHEGVGAKLAQLSLRSDIIFWW